MAIVGDTIRLNASFYTFAGALADPSSVKITIYDGMRDKLIDAESATKETVGVYYYDYLVPVSAPEPLYYEFSGTLEGSTALGRSVLEGLWT